MGTFQEHDWHIGMADYVIPKDILFIHYNIIYHYISM